MAKKKQKTTYFSTAGNPTPVSRVAGGDSHHYTTEETDGILKSCFLTQIKSFSVVKNG